MVNTECVSRLLVSDSLSYKPARLLLSMEFSEEEYWSGLPFPSPGNLSDPGIKPASPALAGEFFTTEPPGKSRNPLQSMYYLSPIYK